MNSYPKSNNEKAKGSQDPLPISEGAPTKPQEIPTQTGTPAAAQKEVSADLQQDARSGKIPKEKKPFRIEVVKNEELSSLETKTVIYAKVGLLISLLALIAAGAAAYFVFQQFKEMADQTDLLNRGARQARVDSAASSAATTKQLAGLQAQITTAQAGTKALQGQFIEVRRSADIAARQLELTDRPWIKVETIMPRGNGSVIPALSFQDVNVTGPPAIKQQTYLNFEVHGRNVGHSTALSVKVMSELFLTQWKNGYSDKVKQEEARFCALRELDSKNWESAAQAVFQGDTFDYYGGVSGAITSDAMNYFSDLPSGPYILPVLIGCVDYQFQASSAHHHIRFVYEIFHASDPRTRFFLAGQGTKADDLNLIRNTSYDYTD